MRGHSQRVHGPRQGKWSRLRSIVVSCLTSLRTCGSEVYFVTSDSLGPGSRRLAVALNYHNQHCKNRIEMPRFADAFEGGGITNMNYCT